MLDFNKTLRVETRLSMRPLPAPHTFKRSGINRIIQATLGGRNATECTHAYTHLHPSELNTFIIVRRLLAESSTSRRLRRRIEVLGGANRPRLREASRGVQE